ncbi:hypothetical protein CDD83_1094 [Cordyceps sp. RAO-2017]|nr:hypothetical protein CDD83_1094 [Cordyceps sp. RAO-2017]
MLSSSEEKATCPGRGKLRSMRCDAPFCRLLVSDRPSRSPQARLGRGLACSSSGSMTTKAMGAAAAEPDAPMPPRRPIMARRQHSNRLRFASLPPGPFLVALSGGREARQVFSAILHPAACCLSDMPCRSSRVRRLRPGPPSTQLSLDERALGRISAARTTGSPGPLFPASDARWPPLLVEESRSRMDSLASPSPCNAPTARGLPFRGGGSAVAGSAFSIALVPRLLALWPRQPGLVHAAARTSRRLYSLLGLRLWCQRLRNAGQEPPSPHATPNSHRLPRPITGGGSAAAANAMTTPLSWNPGTVRLSTSHDRILRPHPTRHAAAGRMGLGAACRVRPLRGSRVSGRRRQMASRLSWRWQHPR